MPFARRRAPMSQSLQSRYVVRRAGAARPSLVGGDARGIFAVSTAPRRLGGDIVPGPRPGRRSTRRSPSTASTAGVEQVAPDAAGDETTAEASRKARWFPVSSRSTRPGCRERAVRRLRHRGWRDGRDAVLRLISSICASRSQASSHELAFVEPAGAGRRTVRRSPRQRR